MNSGDKDSTFDCSSNDETLSTLRFGEQVRSIRNKPIINVLKEANDLSGKIRHLKVKLLCFLLETVLKKDLNDANI